MSTSVWEYLPLDLLVEIFRFLPRRDLLACSLVCSKWKHALNTPSLWSYVIINLDTDLMDPSTILLTRLFYKHMKCLEMGFKNPQLPSKWVSHRFQEITKKVCRYFMVLRERFVQLDCLKIHDWYELCRLKKMIYHLSLFIRSQKRLQKLSFRNAYLNKSDFIKIFSSVQNSQSSILCLDLRNCHHHFEDNMFTAQFINIISQFENLTMLNVDYPTLCKEVLTALMMIKNNVLQHIIVFVEDDEINYTFNTDSWKVVSARNPQLRVGLHFRNVSQTTEVLRIIRKEIPLFVFTMTNCKNLCYRDILERIVQNYRSTLEVLILQIRDSHELLDDLLLHIAQNFPALRNFDYSGIIESFELVDEICRYQKYTEFPNYDYVQLTPRNVNRNNQAYITKVYGDVTRDELNYTLTMKVYNTHKKSTVFYYY